MGREAGREDGRELGRDDGREFGADEAGDRDHILKGPPSSKPKCPARPWALPIIYTHQHGLTNKEKILKQPTL